MGIVDIDVGNPDLFKPPEYKVLPKGKHLFEVANDLRVEPSQSSDNSVIGVELRCQDEDDNKGTVVFDNFTIMNDVSTNKARKAQSINQARLCQFALACGVRTKSEIESGAGIPLEDFKGTRCEAVTSVVMSKNPNTGETKPKATVARYLFDES